MDVLTPLLEQCSGSLASQPTASATVDRPISARKPPVSFDPSKLYRVTSLEHSPEHLQALGLVTTEWARLESTMNMAVAIIIGNANAAEVIMNTLGNHKARRDILRALTVEIVKDKTRQEVLLKILNRIARLAPRRNDVAHTVWGLRHSDGSAVLMMKKPATKQGRFRAVPMSASDIEELAEAIIVTNEELFSWIQAAFEAPEASATTSMF